jgi:uncharacterized protein YlaI
MGHMSEKDKRHLRSGAWCDQVNKPGFMALPKGHFSGKCNRTACTETGAGVRWWNRPMRAYCCAGCERLISRHDEERGTDRAIFDPIPHHSGNMIGNR